MSSGWSYHDNNVFAQIIRGEVEAVRVYEDPEILSIMDLFPQSYGHVLVLPKNARASTIIDVDTATLMKLAVIVKRVATAVRQALQPDGIMVAQFNGSAAGQTVFHLHFHIIPRWDGQPLKGHGHGEMANREELHRCAETIRKAL